MDPAMVLCVPCRCQCRTLLDVFERLHHLVRSTQMPKELQEDLLRRIKSAEIFVMSLFQREVKNQSSTAGRCIRHALSTMSNTAFSCPCNHGTLPGKTPPLTMLAVVKELAEQDSGAFSKAELSALEKGQAPERLWNSVCESCDGPGKLLLCNYCNLAWHPHCAASKNDDWGQDTEGGTGFVCPACILDIDATEHNPPDCALQEPFRIGEWA